MEEKKKIALLRFREIEELVFEKRDHSKISHLLSDVWKEGNQINSKQMFLKGYLLLNISMFKSVGYWEGMGLMKRALSDDNSNLDEAFSSLYLDCENDLITFPRSISFTEDSGSIFIRSLVENEGTEGLLGIFKTRYFKYQMCLRIMVNLIEICDKKIKENSYFCEGERHYFNNIVKNYFPTIFNTTVDHEYLQIEAKFCKLMLDFLSLRDVFEKILQIPSLEIPNRIEIEKQLHFYQNFNRVFERCLKGRKILTKNVEKNIKQYLRGNDSSVMCLSFFTKNYDPNPVIPNKYFFEKNIFKYRKRFEKKKDGEEEVECIVKSLFVPNNFTFRFREIGGEYAISNNPYFSSRYLLFHKGRLMLMTSGRKMAHYGYGYFICHSKTVFYNGVLVPTKNIEYHKLKDFKAIPGDFLCHGSQIKFFKGIGFEPHNLVVKKKIMFMQSSMDELLSNEQGCTINEENGVVKILAFSPFLWIRIAETLKKMKRMELLEEFGKTCLQNMVERKVFSYDKFSRKGRTMRFTDFCSAYQLFIINLLLANKKTDKNFRLLPKEIIIHEIVPFMSEIEVFLATHWRITECIKMDSLELMNYVPVDLEEKHIQIISDIQSSSSSSSDDFPFKLLTSLTLFIQALKKDTVPGVKDELISKMFKTWQIFQVGDSLKFGPPIPSLGMFLFMVKKEPGFVYRELRCRFFDFLGECKKFADHSSLKIESYIFDLTPFVPILDEILAHDDECSRSSYILDVQYQVIEKILRIVTLSTRSRSFFSARKSKSLVLSISHDPIMVPAEMEEVKSLKREQEKLLKRFQEDDGSNEEHMINFMVKVIRRKGILKKLRKQSNFNLKSIHFRFENYITSLMDEIPKIVENEKDPRHQKLKDILQCFETLIYDNPVDTLRIITTKIINGSKPVCKFVFKTVDSYITFLVVAVDHFDSHSPEFLSVFFNFINYSIKYLSDYSFMSIFDSLYAILQEVIDLQIRLYREKKDKSLPMMLNILKRAKRISFHHFQNLWKNFGDMYSFINSISVLLTNYEPERMKEVFLSKGYAIYVIYILQLYDIFLSFLGKKEPKDKKELICKVKIGHIMITVTKHLVLTQPHQSDFEDIYHVARCVFLSVSNLRKCLDIFVENFDIQSLIQSAVNRVLKKEEKRRASNLVQELKQYSFRRSNIMSDVGEIMDTSESIEKSEIFESMNEKTVVLRFVRLLCGTKEDISKNRNVKKCINSSILYMEKSEHLATKSINSDDDEEEGEEEERKKNVYIYELLVCSLFQSLCLFKFIEEEVSKGLRLKVNPILEVEDIHHRFSYRILGLIPFLKEEKHLLNTVSFIIKNSDCLKLKKEEDLVNRIDLWIRVIRIGYIKRRRKFSCNFIDLLLSISHLGIHHREDLILVLFEAMDQDCISFSNVGETAGFKLIFRLITLIYVNFSSERQKSINHHLLDYSIKWLQEWLQLETGDIILGRNFRFTCEFLRHSEILDDKNVDSPSRIIDLLKCIITNWKRFVLSNNNKSEEQWSYHQKLIKIFIDIISTPNKSYLKELSSDEEFLDLVLSSLSKDGIYTENTFVFDDKVTRMLFDYLRIVEQILTDAWDFTRVEIFFSRIFDLQENFFCVKMSETFDDFFLRVFGPSWNHFIQNNPNLSLDSTCRSFFELAKKYFEKCLSFCNKVEKIIIYNIIDRYEGKKVEEIEQLLNNEMFLKTVRGRFWKKDKEEEGGGEEEEEEENSRSFCEMGKMLFEEFRVTSTEHCRIMEHIRKFGICIEKFFLSPSRQENSDDTNRSIFSPNIRIMYLYGVLPKCIGHIMERKTKGKKNNILFEEGEGLLSNVKRIYFSQMNESYTLDSKKSVIIDVTPNALYEGTPIPSWVGNSVTDTSTKQTDDSEVQKDTKSLYTVMSTSLYDDSVDQQVHFAQRFRGIREEEEEEKKKKKEDKDDEFVFESFQIPNSNSKNDENHPIIIKEEKEKEKEEEEQLEEEELKIDFEFDLKNDNNFGFDFINDKSVNQRKDGDHDDGFFESKKKEDNLWDNNNLFSFDDNNNNNNFNTQDFTKKNEQQLFEFNLDQEEEEEEEEENDDEDGKIDEKEEEKKKENEEDDDEIFFF